MRETGEESARQIRELQERLGDSESRRVVIERELGESKDEKEALRGQADKMQTLQDMQAAEIDRLNLQVGNSAQNFPDGLTVSRDSVINLTQKVDQLRFEYLEKDRELTILRNELTLREESFTHQMSLVSTSLTELRAQHDLLVKENEALRAQLQTNIKTDEQ